MSRVLIVSLVFPPDVNSTARLLAELSADLRRLGHDVQVLTTTPHYTRSAAADTAQLRRRSILSPLRESSFDGVPVTHVPMPLKSGAIAARLLAWTWFHLAALAVGIRVRPRPDVVIVPSPLLSLGVIGWIVARGRAFIYNVQELYPDLAVNTGRIRNPVIIRALQKLERFVYERAAAITAIGPTMCQRVKGRTRTPGKVRLVPNFVDLDAIRPAHGVNAFAREHELNGRFVVTYAGNLGLVQGFDEVLEAASLLASMGRICFAFVGDGVLLPRLRADAKRRALANVLFIAHQPYSRVPEIYGASDACLVPLSAAAADEAIPSKVMQIMASERPVIAIAPHGSDLAGMIAASGCGVVVEPGEPRSLASAVEALAADPIGRAEMGRRGRAYAAAHFSRAAVSRSYDELIREVV